MKIYSSNNEDFKFYDISDALDDINSELVALKLNSIITIYEADFTINDASSYLPDVLIEMEEKAYDECGEYADDWLSLTESEIEEFNSILNITVNELLKKFKKTPKFGSVGISKELKFRVTDLEDISKWEQK